MDFTLISSSSLCMLLWSLITHFLISLPNNYYTQAFHNVSFSNRRTCRRLLLLQQQQQQLLPVVHIIYNKKKKSMQYPTAVIGTNTLSSRHTILAPNNEWSPHMMMAIFLSHNSDNIDNDIEDNNNDNDNIYQQDKSLFKEAHISPILSTTKSANQIPLLLTTSTCKPSQMSPTSLAYIGDVVYEMCIRCRYVWPSRRTSDLQKVVVAKVRAETQSIIFQKMLESFSLLQEEQTIVSRGRNAGSPKKRGPKRLYQSTSSNTRGDETNSGQQLGQGGGGPSVYQDSTALEALIGYLYLTDGERCNELLNFVGSILDHMDDEEGIV